MSLPDGFEELSAEEQRRIRDTGSAIVHMAQEAAGGLIIAPPPSRDGFFSTGSYFLLSLEDGYWLGTANHVLDEFEKAVVDDPTIAIQAGELRFDPRDRIVKRDPDADVCLVRLAVTEAPLTKVSALSAILGWPPPAPREGDYIAVSGYPASVRVRPTHKRVHFNAMSAIFRVTQVGERHCSCHWEREEWLYFDGPPPPPPGEAEIGGMSGGPALIIRGLGFPLVGAISQFHSGFEILRVGLFQPPVFGEYPPFPDSAQPTVVAV